MRTLDSSSSPLVGAHEVPEAASAEGEGTTQTPLVAQRSVAQGGAFQVPGYFDRTTNRLVYDARNDDVPPAIDEWLKAKGYNCFGDPLDTVYPGGTPLFNERTGEQYSRFGHIFVRHPYVCFLLPGNGLPRCEQQRPVERPRLGGSGLSEIMKRIEELRAEIRKIWEALLRCSGSPRAKRLLQSRLKALEKIILLLYMKMAGGGGDSRSTGTCGGGNNQGTLPVPPPIGIPAGVVGVPSIPAGVGSVPTTTPQG